MGRKKVRSKRYVSIPPVSKPVNNITDLYLEMHDNLVKAFSRTLTDAEFAEDLSHDVFEKLLRYPPQSWDKIEALVATIANCLRADFNKDRYSSGDTQFIDDILEFECHDEGITDPMRLMVIAEARLVIDEFIATLSPKHQGIFTDYYFNDFDIQDLVDKHGSTRKSISTELRRMRKKFEMKFGEYDLVPEETWIAGGIGGESD